MSRLASVAAAAVAMLLASPVLAAPKQPGAKPAARPASPKAPRRSAEPHSVRGVEREAREPGDAARAVGWWLLWLPRRAVDLVFVATGTAAGLVEDDQVVPRVRDLVEPAEGEIRAFPTAFIETGIGFNVGARLIGRARGVASTVRAGWGGASDVVAESRLRFGTSWPVPLALSLEALHDVRSERGFRGLGQEPSTDPRNRFVLGAPLAAVFSERRERFIAGAGARPAEDLELFVSTGLLHRHVSEPVEARPDAIGAVFEPGSVPGALGVWRIVYVEAALRTDTRASRAAPSTGMLLEGYAGRGGSLGELPAGFVRWGGRVALFVKVRRSSNVLSPKLVLDLLYPEADATVPFTELPAQPDFRGFDDRRDRASAVASLDYRWTLMKYAAARLFFDVARVAPSIDELRPENLRWATGGGLDLFSRHAQLGSLAVSGGPDGVRFFFSFGVASGFGDRQHRD